MIKEFIKNILLSLLCMVAAGAIFLGAFVFSYILNGLIGFIGTIICLLFILAVVMGIANTLYCEYFND